MGMMERDTRVLSSNERYDLINGSCSRSAVLGSSVSGSTGIDARPPGVQEMTEAAP
jgi:hypothetical protein